MQLAWSDFGKRPPRNTSSWVIAQIRRRDKAPQAPEMESDAWAHDDEALTRDVKSKLDAQINLDEVGFQNWVSLVKALQSDRGADLCTCWTNHVSSCSSGYRRMGSKDPEKFSPDELRKFVCKALALVPAQVCKLRVRRDREDATLMQAVLSVAEELTGSSRSAHPTRREEPHRPTVQFPSLPKPPTSWRVLAKAVKVRAGWPLDSERLEDLVYGSVVLELDMRGELLHFSLQEGTGPKDGFITVTSSSAIADVVVPLSMPYDAPPEGWEPPSPQSPASFGPAAASAAEADHLQQPVADEVVPGGDWMVVTHDWSPTQEPNDVEVYLELSKGDLLRVRHSDGSGWSQGHKVGTTDLGWFPTDNVTGSWVKRRAVKDWTSEEDEPTGVYLDLRANMILVSLKELEDDWAYGSSAAQCTARGYFPPALTEIVAQ